MNAAEKKERRISWAILFVCPASLLALCAYIGLLDDGSHLFDLHPRIYLQTTCLLWACIMTILPILRLKRILALPAWFMIMIYADMYIFVTSLYNGMYMELEWWANFTHVVSSLVVASIVFMALCIMESRSPPHVSFGSRGCIVSLLIGIACAFGIIWEIGEGLVEIVTHYDYMSYGAVHTLYNLAADLIGALIMAAIAWYMIGKYGAEHFASTVRMGKKNIDTGE